MEQRISPPWKDYQEEAASFFRSLGLEAQTEVVCQGVRTSHAIDVLVKSRHVGFDVVWLIECKHWKVSVSKLHVLALREIVADLGADRGILLSEAGFQSGAIEASKLTNVQVTSLAELSSATQNDVNAMRLRELFDRVEICNRRYWDIPKAIRIEKGLRPSLESDPSFGYYSANFQVSLCRDLVTRAFRGVYPIERDDLEIFFDELVPKKFNSAQEVVEFVSLRLTELESKLNAVSDP